MNYGSLTKGTNLSQGFLEATLGVKADEDIEKFKIDRLGLGATIEQAIRKEQGIEVFLKYIGRELHILTDRAAAIEAPKRHEQAVKKLRRTARKSSDIDTSKLNDKEQARHEFMQRKSRYQLDALNKSRRTTSELLQPVEAG